MGMGTEATANPALERLEPEQIASLQGKERGWEAGEE